MQLSGYFHSSHSGVGFWRRVVSMLYDLLLVIALLMVLTGLVFGARRGNAFDPQSLWFRLLLVTGWWAYFAWCWTHGGQTVGMRAWRLVLTHRDGTAVGLAAASLRFLCAGFSALAVGLGFAWILFDRDRLAWHDRLSRTELRLRSKLPKPQ